LRPDQIALNHFLAGNHGQPFLIDGSLHWP